MVVSLHEMNPLSLGFLALSVGFQHLVVFIKYRYKHLHSFLLICLELWFQLESYYALTFATASARVGIGMLLTSHYSKFLIAENICDWFHVIVSDIYLSLHTQQVWLIHGIMQTSLAIFMKDGSADKVDEGEDDPNLSETEERRSGSGSIRSMSNSVHKQHSLRLYSSLHSIGKESALAVDNDDAYTLPDTIDEGSSTSSIPTRRHSIDGSLNKHGSLRLFKSSFYAIDEEEGGKSNEKNVSSKPNTNISAEDSPRVLFQNSKNNGDGGSRRSMLQSRPPMLVAQKSRLFDSNEVMHLMGYDEKDY